jgi:hypothetical protein
MVLRQTYVPQNRRANRNRNYRVQNSHLTQCIYWGVRGVTISPYTVYDYSISGHTDLLSI